MKWGKYAKIFVKMFEISCFLAVPTTLTLFALSRSKKMVDVSGFQKYLFFPLEQIVLELFSFIRATLFWDTLQFIELELPTRFTLKHYRFCLQRFLLDLLLLYISLLK